MAIIGALFAVMVISSALVLSACMLVGRHDPAFKRANRLSREMNDRRPGATSAGRYSTRIPHCRFEPEDLEEIQVIHHS